MKIKYIFSSYFIGILFFTLFRILLVVVYACNADSAIEINSLLLKSFAIGWQFDTCISCYLLALPLILTLVDYFLKLKSNIFKRIIHILTCTLFCIAFLVSAADIPYFNYFFTHLNASIFTYFTTFGFLFEMIVQEISYLIYFFLFLGICVGYVLLMNLNYKHFYLKDNKRISYFKSIPLAILLVGLCVIGMRGRIELKSPLRVGTAYHCNDAFLNNVGLNPSFVLIKSIEEHNKTANKDLQLLDSEKANALWLSQKQNKKENISEIKLNENTNVVLIIMESMSADKSGHFNPSSQLTPCLDRLIDSSYSYEKAYTAGIHTYNGVYSTLFSHPAIFARHSLKTTQIPQMCGLSNVLAENGYQTFYFTTHDSQFDNIAGFLYANGIQNIISQSDYPSNEVKSTLGVSDHIMYAKAIETISSLKKDKPFFVCMLSSSDHAPYILPTDIPFKPKSKELKDQMVEYADWAIGSFIKDAQKQDWFSNTLFVFVADHGYVKPNSKYEMPLSYHHTPMFLYCPSQISSAKDTSLALQIDLAPTLLSMLIPNYENHTLGIDLQKQERPYVYFSADNRLGVLDKEYFYIFEQNGKEKIYRLDDDEKINRIDKEQQRADKMRDYAFSMLQVSNDMLKTQQCNCKKK
ncbi:MAG: sulfatase-like hydrolase/transferase [Bacteroidales bacterium]|nr:sulfatase-like hydrolase/transferase [Bacteroidales bacterium]